MCTTNVGYEGTQLSSPTISTLALAAVMLQPSRLLMFSSVMAQYRLPKAGLFPALHHVSSICCYYFIETRQERIPAILPKDSANMVSCALHLL